MSSCSRSQKTCSPRSTVAGTPQTGSSKQSTPLASLAIGTWAGTLSIFSSVCFVFAEIKAIWQNIEGKPTHSTIFQQKHNVRWPNNTLLNRGAKGTSKTRVDVAKAICFISKFFEPEITKRERFSRFTMDSLEMTMTLSYFQNKKNCKNGRI